MGDTAKKSEQLGESFSRASGRLKKMYLLNLLQRLGEDDCYRCGDKITTIDDMSIEHKQRWLDVDPNLFWDLDNVTHSHRDCNSRAGGQTSGEDLHFTEESKKRAVESSRRAGRIGGKRRWELARV